jgi:hypothetical protein
MVTNNGHTMFTFSRQLLIKSINSESTWFDLSQCNYIAVGSGSLINDTVKTHFEYPVFTDTCFYFNQTFKMTTSIDDNYVTSNQISLTTNKATSFTSITSTTTSTTTTTTTSTSTTSTTIITTSSTTTTTFTTTITTTSTTAFPTKIKTDSIVKSSTNKLLIDKIEKKSNNSSFNTINLTNSSINYNDSTSVYYTNSTSNLINYSNTSITNLSNNNKSTLVFFNLTRTLALIVENETILIRYHYSINMTINEIFDSDYINNNTYKYHNLIYNTTKFVNI